jgi:O-antigen/teichoic acid export membrane protein
VIKYILNTDLKLRYVLTVISSILIGAINFYIQILVSKELSVEAYGEYLFLLGVFIVFLPFVAMGTEKAFFSFISEKKQNKRFYKYYFLWILFELMIIFLFVYLIYYLNIQNTILMTDSIALTILMLIFTFSSVKLSTILKYIYESNKLSNVSQLFSLVTAVAHVVLLFIFSYYQLLSLVNIILIGILVFLFFHAASALYIHKNSIIVFSNKTESLKDLVNKYYIYSLPLLLAGFVGLVSGYFENWFLVFYGNFGERANFGVAEKISGLVLVFTAAIVNIFWKEISSLHQLSIQKMERVINNIQNILFIFTVSCVVLILMYSEYLLYYSFGDKFSSALFSLELFFISVIFISQGQLLATILLATHLTKFNLIFTTFATISRIGISYLLLFTFNSFDTSEIVILAKLIVLVLNAIISEFVIYKVLKMNYSNVFNKYIISVITTLVLCIGYYALTYLLFDNLYAYILHICISFLFLMYLAYRVYTRGEIYGIRVLS